MNQDQMKAAFERDAREIMKQIDYETAMLQSGYEAYMADYPGDAVVLMDEVAHYINTIKATNLKLEEKITKDPVAFAILSDVTFTSIHHVGVVLMGKVKTHGVHYASWNYRTMPRVLELVKVKYPEAEQGFAEGYALAARDHDQVLAGTFKDPATEAAEAFLKAQAELDKLNDVGAPPPTKEEFLKKLGIN
jgi:inosine-uridine nucleoside N-ribohydrolase